MSARGERGNGAAGGMVGQVRTEDDVFDADEAGWTARRIAIMAAIVLIALVIAIGALVVIIQNAVHVGGA